MHRAAHLGVDGPEGNRLIWLYDIHLLAAAMTAAQWRDFAQMCAEKNMRRVSLDAFTVTRQAFATPFPDEVIRSLAPPAAEEISGAYLDSDRLGLLMTDMRALASWRSRATLMCELAFPPADYLLAKYRARSRWLLPWWYVRRAAEGVWRIARS